MEGRFLEEWNSKFGVQPPEWIRNIQDVEKEIRDCECRIERLRSQLSQELFLLEWLEKKASTENSIKEGSPHLSDSEEPEVERQPCAVNAESPLDSISPESSPLDLTKSRESLKSRGSSVYFSAKQQSSQENTSISDSPIDSDEEKTLVKTRRAERANSTDERIAKAVRRKLIEQGRHWSCQFLDLELETPRHSPVIRKRSMSDPPFLKYRNQQPTSSCVEVHSGCQERSPSHALESAPPVPALESLTEKSEGESDSPAASKMQVEPENRVPDETNERRHDSLDSEAGSGNFLYDGYTILAEEKEAEEDSLGPLLVPPSTRRQPRLHKGVYTASLYYATESDDIALLTNGDSEQTSEEEPSIPETNEGGYGDPPLEEGSPADTSVLKRRHKELPPLTNRSSYVEDEECETPKGEDDPSMALTRDVIERALGERQDSGQSTDLEASSDSQNTPHSSLKMMSPATLLAPEISLRTLVDPEENEDLSTRLKILSQVSSESNLLEISSGLEESMELDEATISALTMSNEMFGSRSNSVSSLPGLLSTHESPSPMSYASPTHQGVNLRATTGKKRDRKRMGNAELDMNRGWEELMLQQSRDISPSRTTSSLSSTSPLSEEGNSFVLSPTSPSPEFPPHPPSPTSHSPPPSLHASRIYPVRRSTVVVHGEVLVIRKLVVAGIVSAEKNYLECLTVMKEYYRKPLLALATTSQPIVTEREVNTIFYRVEDILDMHHALHEKLEVQLSNWGIGTCVGEFFADLCRNLKLYKDYVEMYQRSLECLDKCKQESATFRKFLEDVHATVTNQFKDMPRVNELLRRPIERLQSYSLVLNDLCQHTPDDHADYQVLRQSLYAMSAFIASTHDPQSFRQLSGGFNRELVKEGLVVELSEGLRKVRRLFLFHDVLVSAKQKPSRSGLKFEPKWYLPLNELLFHPHEEIPEAHRPVPVTSDMELSVMKNKIAELKAQIGKDPSRDRTASHPERDGSFRRNITGFRALHTIKSGKSEKLKKKLQEQQVSYWIASPSLPLRVYGRMGKQFVFLLHSEDERENWISAIKKLQPKAITDVILTQFELQDLLSRQTINDVRKVEETMVPTIDDEYLTGVLRVRVVVATDVKAKPVSLYCTLELDEYGKFDRKARTLPTSTDSATLITTWDQDFEMEVVGAHIMKVMVCSKSLLKEECYATGKFRLPIKELRQNKRHKAEVKLQPQGSIILIIEYFSSLASMGRKPALLSSGVFGVPLDVVAKRERHDIPLIVQTCVDEVERRGMSEVGIYRVAGVLRDVEELRQAFDTDYLKAQVIAFETDIHAVAGLLKKYFRELPDPLFTDELYMNFVHGLGLSDPESRDQCLVTLLHSLPQVNFKTAVFLFKHLRRVAANAPENKMTLNNLATVFGPNLLRPGSTSGEYLSAYLSAVTMDVVTPVSVVLYFLNCSEEYFDENLFKSPTETQGSYRKEQRKGDTRKKLSVTEEEDSGRRSRKSFISKRESVI